MQAVRRHLIGLFSILLSCSMCFGQQVPLSNNGQKVKIEISSFSEGDDISVIRKRGPEEFGKFKTSDDSEFVIFDVDNKRESHLSYDDVRKVRHGYGGYNYATRRHTDFPKSLVIGAVVVAVILGVAIGTASQLP